MKEIFFITGNAGKREEVQRYLQAHQVTGPAGDAITITAVRLDLTEVQEATAEEVSRAKAVEGFCILNNIDRGAGGRAAAAPPPDAELKPVLIEDTSLCMDALNGLPGPYIKWFLHAIGTAGLIKMLQGFRTPDGDDGADGVHGAPAAHVRAHASCVFSLCVGYDAATGAAKVHQFVGTTEGMIVDAERGKSGFGWDCIFAPREQPTGAPYSKTYAELTTEEKVLISHRTNGLRKLCEFLASEES